MHTFLVTLSFYNKAHDTVSLMPMMSSIGSLEAFHGAHDLLKENDLLEAQDLL